MIAHLVQGDVINYTLLIAMKSYTCFNNLKVKISDKIHLL